jgi:hypothetical protein
VRGGSWHLHSRRLGVGQCWRCTCIFCSRWHQQIWEGHSIFRGRIGTSGDAFGWWKDASGVWGGLLRSKHHFVTDLWDCHVFLCIQNTQKHDSSPSYGWILTIPTWQSLTLSMINRRNARGGQQCHHRRRTGAGWLRRWTCKFFDVADIGGSREGRSGWMGQ